MQLLLWFAAVSPLVTYGLVVEHHQPSDETLSDAPPSEGPPSDAPPGEAAAAPTDSVYPTNVNEMWKLACPEEEFSRYMTIVCSPGVQNCGSEWCQDYKHKWIKDIHIYIYIYILYYIISYVYIYIYIYIYMFIYIYFFFILYYTII